jgi:hypothetical protein
MFLIIFLIIATGGISAYARGRGGNPLVWGGIAVGGYVLAVLVVPATFGVSPDSDERYWFMAGGLAWMGAVAFCARFLLGRSRMKSSRMWTCPNCKYLNQHYAVICEACKHPFGEPAPKS